MRWERVKFLDVFKDITGGNEKIKKSDYLETGNYPVIDQGKILIGGYANSSNPVQRQGSVIIFGDHTSVLKYVNFDFLLGADGVKVIEPQYGKVFPKYAFYALSRIDIPNTGYDRKYKYLKRSFFPLPPLPIQKKIAAILDAADDYRQKTKALLYKYDQLTQSIFLDMFGDPVKNEKDWEEIELGKNLNSIENGWSPKCDNYNVLNSKDIAVLKLGCISKRVFLMEENKAVFKGTVLKKIVTPLEGDILFSRKNTRELVGATAMVFKNHNNLLLPDTIFKLNLKNTLSPFYIWYLFNSPIFKIKIQNLASGAAASMLNISKAKLMSLKIPVPSIDHQLKFAKKALAIRLQKTQSQDSLLMAESLFQSLLQKAFKGELVN